MKLSNADLATALRQQYAGNPALWAFAQLLCERPTSKQLNLLALRVVDLPQLPVENMAEALPSLTAAELALTLAYNDMKAGYSVSPAHGEVYARRLAWAASVVARILEWQRIVTTKEWTAPGTFETLRDYNGTPWNTRKARGAVVDDVLTFLAGRKT